MNKDSKLLSYSFSITFVCLHVFMHVCMLTYANLYAYSVHKSQVFQIHWNWVTLWVQGNKPKPLKKSCALIFYFQVRFCSPDMYNWTYR